jgi:putative membrane protein insertion efficiency factor
MRGALRRLPALPAIALVRAYQFLLGPLLGGNCKYHPSCSHYALDALRRYGLLRGSVLAGWRLLRCNPWSHGGVDHVDDQRLFARRPSEARHA